MKCKSCKDDVPQKFAHAISVNVCPLCGKEIMDAKLQTLFNELKNVMTQAQEYPEAVADWFFSNHKMKIVDEQNLVQTGDDQQPQKQEKKMLTKSANEGLEVSSEAQENSVFAKRAGINISRMKADRAKKVVDYISGNVADPSEFINEEEGVSSADISNSEPLNSYEEQEIIDLFAQDNVPQPTSPTSAHTLQLDKLRKLRAQENVSGGGGGGMFRRSS